MDFVSSPVRWLGFFGPDPSICTVAAATPLPFVPAAFLSHMVSQSIKQNVQIAFSHVNILILLYTR